MAAKPTWRRAGRLVTQVNRLEAATRRVIADLANLGARAALVGGLAVSARCEPRTTRDADLAVAVEDDAVAEKLVFRLRSFGYEVLTQREQHLPVEGALDQVVVAGAGHEHQLRPAARAAQGVRGGTRPLVGHPDGVHRGAHARGQGRSARCWRAGPLPRTAGGGGGGIGRGAAGGVGPGAVPAAVARSSVRPEDALQLAAALVACEEHPEQADFVSLDDRLRKAARSEGFRVFPA